MAIPSVTYSNLVNGQTSDADQIDTNFQDLINGMTDGSKDFSINALTLAGTLTVNGNTVLGNAVSDTVSIGGTITSNLIATDDTYDIGASGATRFRDIYSSRNMIAGGYVSATGTAAANVAFNFGQDIDTGFYKAVSSVAVAASGTDVMYWNPSGTVYITASGAASDPSLARTGDTNTGIYFPAGDQFAVSCGGVQSAAFTSTGVSVPGTLTVTGAASVAALTATTGTFSGVILGPTGAAAGATYSFTGDPDTGLYRSANNQPAMAAGGTDVMYWNSSGQVYITASGAESAPSLARTGDTNTGFYFPAADQFAIATGGTARLTITTSVVTSAISFAMTSQTIASAASITALSSSTSVVLFSGSTATQIHGITAGVSGQIIKLISVGANLTIMNESASASAANRITTQTGSDVGLPFNVCELVYNATTSRWILVTGNA